MKHFLKKLFLGDPATNTISNDFHKDKRKENIRAIWHNEHHNDYGLEKIFRLFLAASQFVFPSSYIKHYLERYGTHYKDLAVDLIVVSSSWHFQYFYFIFKLQHNHWLARPPDLAHCRNLTACPNFDLCLRHLIQTKILPKVYAPGLSELSGNPVCFCGDLWFRRLPEPSFGTLVRCHLF
jgi:hypothetical protein